jgi:hypothetical protein
MENTKEKLKENGTALNLNADDVLNISLGDVVKLENKRKDNIRRGAR